MPYDIFFISLFQQFLQLPHLPPLSGALQVLDPSVTTVDVCGQLFTAGWSIIFPENRITRLEGALSRYFFVHASRVGIQCWTEGVNLQTLKILAKCLKSCTSPESCHLKNFTFLELILMAIALTHSGWRSAFNLLYCAFIIAGNLV